MAARVTRLPWFGRGNRLEKGRRVRFGMKSSRVRVHDADCGSVSVGFDAGGFRLEEGDGDACRWVPRDRGRRNDDVAARVAPALALSDVGPRATTAQEAKKSRAAKKKNTGLRRETDRAGRMRRPGPNRGKKSFSFSISIFQMHFQLDFEHKLNFGQNHSIQK
jgi:hypothetical protein